MCEDSNVCVFLFLAGKSETFPSKSERSADKFHFEDIFKGRFSPAMYSCDWVAG